MSAWKLAPLLAFASGAALADCGYVYVDNKAVWVCNYNAPTSNPQPCHYIYVDNKPVWVCKYN